TRRRLLRLSSRSRRFRARVRRSGHAPQPARHPRRSLQPARHAFPYLLRRGRCDAKARIDGASRTRNLNTALEPSETLFKALESPADSERDAIPSQNTRDLANARIRPRELVW